jgi:hypothetical protein
MPEPWEVFGQPPSTAQEPWEVYGGAKAPAAALDPNRPRTWSEVGSEAISNIPGSAYEYGKDIVQAVAHPIDTATNLGGVIAGGVQKAGQAAGLPGIDTSQVPKADAVGEYFANRYGGIEEFKKAVATDPVAVFGDFSTVLTGGGGATARLPGIVGRVGRVVSTAGRAIDPLTPVVKGAELTARGAAGVSGMLTGTGGKPATLALETGLEGGERAAKFREEMRGKAPTGDVVQEAVGAVDSIRNSRGAAYRQDMQQLGLDRTILSWNEVDTVVNEMNKVATFKGQSLSPSTQNIRNTITQAVDDWKQLRAGEYWTPEGFDALKKKVGDIRDATERGTPERRVADMAYHGIRNSIVSQVPEYAKYMKAYEQSSKLISEMERTLSLNPNATLDTSLRKLQSVMRNNVSTSYGRRVDLAEILQKSGAPHLMDRLAGSTLSSWAPRGLAAKVSAGGSIPASIITALTTGNPAALAGLALLPLTSPRITGEIAHATGRAGRALSPLRTLAPYVRQSGSLPDEEQR